MSMEYVIELTFNNGKPYIWTEGGIFPSETSAQAHAAPIKKSKRYSNVKILPLDMECILRIRNEITEQLTASLHNLSELCMNGSTDEFTHRLNDIKKLAERYSNVIK